MRPVLVIGNKNYSSWSLRAWLALAQAGVELDEQRVRLRQSESRNEILKFSPSGKVPCLIDGDLTVWDSLAICEAANELYVDGRLWPRDPRQRSRARAVTAEMHSSFAALRTHMSMDIRARLPEAGALAQQREDVAQDIGRIQEIWRECLARSGGPFLFGVFSIADAFFAPVITRFVTYAVALPAPLAKYAQVVLDLESMKAWTAAAHAETEVLAY
jgi:glutathione S-transferase